MTERFITLWNSNETRLRRLTADTTALRNGHSFDPIQYVALVNLLNTYPFATSWNLTVPQFAQLVGGPLQMGKRAQLQAKIVERTNPELGMSLVNRTKVMLLALEAVLTGASLGRNAAASVGLGLVGADDVAIGAGSVAIIIVGVLLLGTLAASVVALGQVLTTAATYCLATGCTSAEVVQITTAMADSAVRILSTNPLNTGTNNLTKPGGGVSDLIFWGGLLVVGSGVAYAIWKAQGEPVPERLQRALSSTKSPNLKGLSGGSRKVYDPVAFLEKAMKRHKAGKVDDAYLQSVYHSAIYTDGLSDSTIQSLRDKLKYYPRTMTGHTRMYSDLGEGGYEPDTSKVKELVAKGTREEDYFDTSAYDDMFADDKTPRRNALVATSPLTFAKNAPKNAPLTFAKNAPKNAPSMNVAKNAKPRQGSRLVAILPQGESVTQSKYRAWEIACRAQKISKPSCSPLEEEQVQEIQTRVILPNLSASEMDRVAKALRGGGYSVKVEK